MKPIPAWGCEYCAMASRRKGSVKRHELKYCRKNPNRVTCGSCEHMEADCGVLVEEGYPEYYSELYCDAKDIDLGGVGLNNNTECDQYKWRGK